MTLFVAWNTAMPTSAPRVAVNTGTSLTVPVTSLQIATPAARGIKVVRWGLRFSSAPTVIVRAELVDCNVAATVTAHVAAGVPPYDRTNGTPASLMTLGTTATGYAASGEGSVTATRTGDEYTVPIGVSSYDYEWSLGREFEVAPSRFLRIRTSTTVAVGLLSFIVWDE
jgi:hypothetical protein